MTRTFPADPAAMAHAVAAAVVLKADDGARAANPYYWHRAQPLLTAVLTEIDSYGDADLAAATAELLGDPRSVGAWERVHELVAASVTDAATAPLVRAAREVAMKSRLDYHIGHRYDPAAEPDPDWRSWPGAGPSGGADPEVQVVVPFRDRSASGTRARNLLACLSALADQSASRESYHVTVVESDDADRWRDVISNHVDEYFFAPHRGDFNKCWTVNVGVVNTARPAPLVCVLDADALVDREFIERNAARFHRRGAGGFLPFRDLFYLDAAASARAVGHRRTGSPRPDPASLRGFLVHRAPGVCVWLRRDVFEAIGGMDERFEGWGREDIDFVLRAQLATAFDQYDDQMLHLHHPSSAQLSDGHTVNAHIPLLSWAPTEPIGRLDRFPAEPVRH
ncbi:glycosyltransferase [Krasilnikovia sp. MM14-A1004]|uniref:glycosyltransferase n=1 Tax=Krasilnikovia sp. MM14-A1004 TaxID=3373541 RepID=UPI00399D1D9E